MQANGFVQDGEAGCFEMNISAIISITALYVSRIYSLTDLLINTSGAFGASGGNEHGTTLSHVFLL